MSRIIWSKCGSDSDFSPDAAGVTWTKTGSPSYVTDVQFSKGIVQNTSNYHTTTFTAPTAWTIHWWGKWTQDFVNGDFYWFGVVGNSISLEVYNKNFIPYISGLYLQYDFSPRPTWSNGDVVHYAMAFDWGRSAGDKMKFFVDGVEQTIANAYGETNWVGQTINIRTSGGGGSAPAGNMANIVVEDIFKTDYSDRFYEDGVIPAANKVFIINC